MKLSNFGLGSLLALSLTLTAYAQDEERPQEAEQQPPVTEAQGEGAAIPQESADNSAQFRALDVNEDGQLSVSEAGRVAAIAEIFGSLDSNHDEQLSAEEFAKLPQSSAE